MLFYEVRGVEMEEVSCTVTEEVKSRVDFGTCTWRYALLDGVKTDILDAPRGSHGICPSCGDELISKQGEMNAWHWAHKNGHVCDKWYEPKGAWHCWWQNQFDKAWQEVVIVKKGDDGQEIKHVADICTDEGWIIEFQYSSIRPEMIRAREAFYKKMVWVVSGTRLESDLKKGRALFELSFKESVDGVLFAVLANGGAFNKHWRTANKPVFFDFYGTFDKPVEGANLLCLLPEIQGVEGRIIAKVSQMEFIAEIQQNKLELFLDKFRNLLKTLRAQAAQAKKDEELREAERQRKLEEILKKRKEEEWKAELANPIKFMISLGWVRAYVLLKGEGADKIIKDWAWDGADDEGEVAIHFKNNYTEEDYEREISWKFHEVKSLAYDKVPSYGLLKKFAGCIVGKCSYIRTPDRTFLRGFEFFQTYDFEERFVPCVPDKQKIWELKEPYFTMVNDRKFKLSKIPSCPKCGASLKHRKNSKDGNYFWGCSKFPDCNYVCSFGANGQGTIVKEGVRELNKFIDTWCCKRGKFYHPRLY